VAKGISEKASQEEVVEEFDDYVDTYCNAVNKALVMLSMDIIYYDRVKAD